MTAVERQAHAQALAAAFGVRLIESDKLAPHEGVALPEWRVVLVRSISDESSYAVALHELGHLCAPLGILAAGEGGPNDPARIAKLQEANAWEWARHFALEWTELMEHVARWAEDTYTPPAPPAPPPVDIRPGGVTWDDWTDNPKGRNR